MDKLITLNRRELLKNTTGLLTGLVVAGTPLALMAQGRAWAVDLTAFTSSSLCCRVPAGGVLHYFAW
jgi:hypothetical protein